VKKKRNKKANNKQTKTKIKTQKNPTKHTHAKTNNHSPVYDKSFCYVEQIFKYYIFQLRLFDMVGIEIFFLRFVDHLIKFLTNNF
jgi:hypothetical protein